MAHEWRILAAVMFAELCSVVSLSIVTPGLATWLHEFGNPITVGWIMSSFLLMSAAAAALCGKLGDVYGRKPVLLAILTIVGAGALVSLSSKTAEVIIAGRTLQGMSGAVLPLCYALAREHLPPERFTFAAGCIIAAASGGAAFAFLLGGALVDQFGTRSLFMVMAGFAFAGVLVLRVAIPPSRLPRLDEKIDWIGGLLFAPGIAALLIAVSRIRSEGLASLSVGAWAAGGLAVLVLWRLHEKRQAHPMVDLRLLGGRQRGLANIAMVCMSLGAFQLTELFSLLIQQDPATGVGLGQSATVVGVVKTPAVICGALGSLWAGWIAARRGASFPLLAGALVVVGALSITLVWRDSLPALLVVLMLYNLAITGPYAAVPMVVIANTHISQVGAAMGLMAVVRALSQGIGAQLVAILLASSTVIGANGAHFPDSAGYTRALLWMAFTAVLVAVTAIALRRQTHPRGLSAEPGQASAG